MNDQKAAVARACLEGAEANAMTFPEIVGTLTREGFDSYTVDFRRAIATYYTPDGDSIEVPMQKTGVPVASAFDAAAMQAAIKEAQQQVQGYTYIGFCKKASAAGCASYVVSLSGRRALYIGRTGETHVELFPQ